MVCALWQAKFMYILLVSVIVLGMGLARLGYLLEMAQLVEKISIRQTHRVCLGKGKSQTFGVFDVFNIKIICALGLLAIVVRPPPFSSNVPYVFDSANVSNTFRSQADTCLDAYAKRRNNEWMIHNTRMNRSHLLLYSFSFYFSTILIVRAFS